MYNLMDRELRLQKYLFFDAGPFLFPAGQEISDIFYYCMPYR